MHFLPPLLLANTMHRKGLFEIKRKMRLIVCTNSLWLRKCTNAWINSIFISLLGLCNLVCKDAQGNNESLYNLIRFEIVKIFSKVLRIQKARLSSFVSFNSPCVISLFLSLFLVSIVFEVANTFVPFSLLVACWEEFGIGFCVFSTC